MRTQRPQRDARARRAATASTASRRKPRLWTPDEDAILRRRYPRLRRRSARAGEMRALLRALPGRTESAIRTRAQDIGVRMRGTWTPAEDATLRKLWPDTATRHLRAALRPRSWSAIEKRAVALGLGARWQGYVSITVAAVALGYNPIALRHLLEREGVRVLMRHSGDAVGAHRIVCLDDARDAVLRALRKETPAEAARRLGVQPKELRVWLRMAGLLAASPGPRNRSHTRLDSASIDEALVRLAREAPEGLPCLTMLRRAVGA